MAATSDFLARHGLEGDRGIVRSRKLIRIGRPLSAVAAVAATATLALACTLAGCSAPPLAVTLPPPGAMPDYQLGGAYEPEVGVGVIVRDRGASPASGTYSICYVNGFQTQPGEIESWPSDLLLQREGETVFDPDWPDEALLDTSSADRRERISDIVIDWVEGCADSGFDAVEFDNLDSYTRSHGALTLDDNLALATMLVDAAHAAGLAAGQKNAAEDAPALHQRAGFDFAVTEECAVYEECGAYEAVYGDHVIDIEYADDLPRSFAEMCADDRSPASMVLRDRNLVTPAEDAYVFEFCPR